MSVLVNMRNLLICLLIVISCKEKDPELIHPAFKTYADRFYAEAENRGHTLPDNLEIVFANVLPGDYCGYADYHIPGFSDPFVRIKDTEYCWYSRTDIEKENLIFHELGHALLNRPHIEKHFQGGYPASIMCTSNNLNSCNNYQTYYSLSMRDYYLDELFNRSAGSPEWTINQNLTKTLLKDSMASLSYWETFTSDENDDSYEFHIDSSTFNSKSISIEKKESTNSDNSLAYLVRRFEISDFQECSSIKVRAKIQAPENFIGYVGLGISLRESNDHRFMFHSLKESSSAKLNNAEIFESEIFCIPEKTSVVSVSITFKSSIPAVIYVDEVEIDLWN